MPKILRCKISRYDHSIRWLETELMEFPGEIANGIGLSLCSASSLGERKEWGPPSPW